MFTRICNYLSILSAIFSLSIIGTGFFTYKYVTSPQFEAIMMEKVMEGVSKILPNQIEKKMPKVTGPMVEMSDDTKWFLDLVDQRNKEYIEWETKGKWEQ